MFPPAVDWMIQLLRSKYNLNQNATFSYGKGLSDLSLAAKSLKRLEKACELSSRVDKTKMYFSHLIVTQIIYEVEFKPN